jgi:hypothetical protein
MSLLKLLVSGDFYIGLFIGLVVMYIFKPLVEKLFDKLLGRN